MKKTKRKKNYFKGGPSGIIVALLIFGSLMAILVMLTDYTSHVKSLSYTSFLAEVKSGKVVSVRVSGQDVYGVLKNKENDKEKFETVMPDDQKVWDILRENNVDIQVESSSGQINFWYLLPFLSFLLTMFLIAYFVRQMRGSGGSSGGNLFNMGKSRAKLFMPSTIKVKFDSVAGAVEAKEELSDVVDFLKSPEKYRKLGAKMTRGVLLVGEPGNGKTLLAKAVAGEANCPFFSISGSDFIEVFVGVGASRVRDLFAQARKHAPSIIFIDEIDAVGRNRGTGLGGGNDEREQTLNQLLTEMDGFQSVGGSVIVLAATNRPDVLDKALLRAGRFDRRVDVPYPDQKSREEILKVHSESVPLDEGVDLAKIARGTPGFSGADLANIVNEAAINASKAQRDGVTIHDFEEARDKMLLGKELKTVVLTERDRKVTAYHESGHALVTLLNPKNADPLHKVTIIPRGKSLGVTHSLPEREKYLSTKDEILADIDVKLGGRAAEELVFNEVTTGSYSDFVRATDVARRVVCSYGMSDNVGLAVYSQKHGSFEYAEKTAENIDAEVENILRVRYKNVLTLLKNNRDKLDSLALKLMEKETLYAGEIYELLDIEPREEHKFS
jgi:cell division protease FtsH